MSRWAGAAARTRGWGGVLVGSLVALGGLAALPAAAAPQDPVEIARARAEVPIGATAEVVRKRLTDALEREVQAKVRQERDAVARDRLKQELPARKRALESSYEELSGPRTPYDVSILTGEFRAGPGEGVLRQSDQGQDTYYLFSGGRLWKTVTTVKPHLDFAGAALRMTLEFGKPSNVEFDQADAARPPVRVQWRVGEHTLELADRRADYGCYTVIAADAAQFQARAKERVSAGTGRRIDPLVQDVMEQDESGEYDDIVDELLRR